MLIEQSYENSLLPLVIVLNLATPSTLFDGKIIKHENMWAQSNINS